MPRSLSAVLPSAHDVAGPMLAWRDRLDDEHRFRTQQIARLDHEIAANPQLHHDGVTLALRHAATVALDEVDAALGRMETGDYGRCTRCGQTIPDDRLEVLPMTAQCMPCQYREQTRGR